jgi:hypothetical protein
MRAAEQNVPVAGFAKQVLIESLARKDRDRLSVVLELAAELRGATAGRKHATTSDILLREGRDER